jgi:hypothetical protein
MKELQAMYFPYASIDDLTFLKTALLYFDKIWLLSSERAFEGTRGEFGELLQDGELVQWINGEYIANHHQDILNDAISTDLSDAGFLGLTRQQGKVWEIYQDKGINAVENLVRPIGTRGNRVRVPYEQGESFLVNMALIAATTGREKLVPLADREEHFSTLQHKLKRGTKGQLERLYGDTIEKEQVEAFISAIGQELVEAVLPSPAEMANIPLQKIKDFRVQYKKDRDTLRDKLFLMIEEITGKEPTISPARMQMKIQTMVNTQLKQLEYDRSTKARLINGFKAVLGAAKELSGTLKSTFTGLSLGTALVPAIPAAASPLADFAEQEITQVSKSDVAYLYRIRKEFGK